MPKIVVQKQEWIKLGYNLFSQAGEKGIIVEKMAKKLRCNKSSFYWHFASRAVFIESLVEYWVQTETSRIIQKVEAEKNLRRKLDLFIELTFQYDPNLDFLFFLKRYARKHTNIQAIIDDVDRQRLDYTVSFLQDLGYEVKEAEITALILYKYLIGHHEMTRYKPLSRGHLPQVKLELSKLIHLKTSV